MVIDARLKSLFFFPAVAATLVLFAVSLLAAVTGGHQSTAWLGSAIASLPLLFITSYLKWGGVERTTDNMPLMLFIGAAGLMVALWEQFIEGTSGWAPTSIAMASVLLLLLYVFWYSRFGRFASSHLMVGGKLPGFRATTVDGESFDSASLLGSPAVLLFYRGNWCPLCMAQIKEMAGRYRDLDELGVRTVLVSPQPAELTHKLQAQYDAPFTYVVDEGNAIAESLGIAIHNGVPVGMPGGYAPDTVLPTLIVCNERGTIVFSDQTDNYRVRPEPDVFLAILRRAGVMAR